MSPTLAIKRNEPNRRAAYLPFGAKRDGPLRHQHILSIKQFTPRDLDAVIAVADEMRIIVERIGAFDLLHGKVLAVLFYEPSTRTSASFIAAMQRLGGGFIPINEVRYSSVAKGESLPDTIRTLEGYADVIALRHPETGAAALAAQYARKPIINAGDGIGEHPTQALLDLFTLIKARGALDGATVTMLGDLKYGRTVHSLARALALYNVKLNYVSPDILRMPRELVAELNARGIQQSETSALQDVLGATDVLYVTRVQKERFANLEEYETVKDAYVITPETLAHAKADMALMHPLPRVGEISPAVDCDPRAAYFRQVEYGMYVRMALLAMVLGKA